MDDRLSVKMSARFLLVWAVIVFTSTTAAAEWEEDMPLFSYTFPKRSHLFAESIDIEEYHDVEDILNIAPHLQNMDLQVLNLANVTAQCLKDTRRFLGNLKGSQVERYAVSMVDSFGKPESGILQGRIRWLGTYDECVAAYAAATDQDAAINGLYCRATLALPSLSNKTNFELGVCFSSACTDYDVASLMDLFFNSRPDGKFASGASIPRAVCQRDRKWTSGDIVALTIVCILSLLSVVSTTIDLARQTRAHVRKREVRKAKLRAVQSTDETSTVVVVLKTKCPSKMEPGLSLGGVTQFCSVKTAHEMEEEDKARLQKKGRSWKLRGWQRTIFDVVMCWSWLTNGAKLIKPAAKSGANLAVVNGIRTLSIWVVILGHTYYFFGQTLGNLAALPQMLTRFSFQPLLQAPLAVDAFFFLSGMLVAYSVLRELNKRKGRMAWHLYYFHRIWRLTPAYMFVLMVYCTVFLHVLRGPFMTNLDYVPSQVNCHTQWWANLLYINNLYPGTMTEQCLGWSWYLANDMQFYVVSPIFLYLLYKNWQMGLALICVTAGACMTLTGSVAFSAGYTPIDRKDGTPNPMFSELYVQPWYRISPYMVGLVTGWIVVRYDKIKLQKRYVTLGWCLCSITMSSLMYGLYYYYHNGADMDLALGAFYTGVYRFCWGAVMAWIVIACLSGYGGPVNRLLGWQIWSVLGRLTYCAYLVHPVIMQFFYLSTRTLFYLNDANVIWLFLGHMVMTYMVAFATSMMVEAPMMGLEKILFRRQPRAPPRRPTTTAAAAAEMLSTAATATTTTTTQQACNGHHSKLPEETDDINATTGHDMNTQADHGGEGHVNEAFQADDAEKPRRHDSMA